MSPPTTPPIDAPTFDTGVDTGVDTGMPGAFGEPLDPGFRRMGRSPLVFDGEELLELASDGLVRRSAKLAVLSRVPIAAPQSLALMPDRSVVVLSADHVHHVVEGRIAVTTESRAKLVVPTASARVYWAVTPTTVQRAEIGRASAKVDFFLPENATAMTAQAAGDGSLLISDAEGLLRIDRAITSFAWDVRAEFLAAGPDPSRVWSAHSDFEALPSHLVLRTLEKGRATAMVTHRLAAGEAFVHVSSEGAEAVAIVGRSVGANEAALSLVVFDAKGERWRAPLGDRTGGYFAAMSPTRVVVQAARGRLRVWNRATGKPA